MRRFVKYCVFILLVLLAFISCKMDINNIANNEKSEGLDFTFRAPTNPSLEGAILKVVLTSDDIPIDTKSVQFDGKNNEASFHFDQLPIGIDVDVTVTLEKDGIIYFHGKKSTSIKDVNDPLKIELIRTTVSLTLSPKLDFNTFDVEGSVFKVKVNGGKTIEKHINVGDTSVSVETPLLEVGIPVTIEGSIVRDIVVKEQKQQVVLYSIVKTIQNITGKEKSLSLDVNRENLLLQVCANLPEMTIPQSALDGKNFIVDIDDGTPGGLKNNDHPISPGENVVGIPFGYYSIGHIIKSITGRIEDDNKKLLYVTDTITDYTITEDSTNKGLAKPRLTLKKAPVTINVKSTIDTPPSCIDNTCVYTVYVEGKKVSSQNITLPTPTDVPTPLSLEASVQASAGDVITVAIEKDNVTYYHTDSASSYTVNDVDKEATIPLTRNTTTVTITPQGDFTDTEFNDTTFELTYILGDSGRKTVSTPFVEGIAKATIPNAYVGENILIEEFFIAKPHNGQSITLFENLEISIDQTLSNTPIDETIPLNRVNIKPSLSIHIPTLEEPIEGYKLKLYTNNNTASPYKELPLTTENSNKDMTIPFDYVTYNTILNGVIEKEVTDPASGQSSISRYYASSDIQITSTSISLSLEPYQGRFLWGISSSGPNMINFNVSRTVGNFDNPSSLFSISNVSPNRKERTVPIGLVDYCLLPNGDICVLTNTEGRSLYESQITWASTSSKTSFTKKLSEKQDLPTPIEENKLFAIAPIGNGILTIAITARQSETQTISPYYIGYIEKQEQDFTITDINVTNPDVNLPTVGSDTSFTSNTITAMTIEGNTVYFASSASTTNNVSPSGEKSNSIKLFKMTVNIDTKQATWENVSNTIETYPNYIVSDLIVDDKYLYATIIDCGQTPALKDVSRGGLLKINKSNLTEIASLGVPDSATDIVLKDNLSKYLVGPRKFVAIKPKELQLVDDGCTAQSAEQTPEHAKRIVTVDLEKFTIKNCDEVFGPDFFDSFNSNNSEFQFDYERNTNISFTNN